MGIPMVRLLGNDCSKYQDVNTTQRKVDFQKMYQAGSRYCFIRATFGNAIDEDFTDYWAAAKAAHMPRGAYGFLTYGTSPEVQAQTFLKCLGNDIGELPLSADFEEYEKIDGTHTLPPHAAEYLKRYLDVLEKETGKIPFIYTGYYLWLKYGTPALFWKRYKLWLAAYGTDNPLVPKPWDTMTFHQFGQLDGATFGAESKLIDANYYFGTQKDFNNEFCISIEPPPVIVPPEKPKGLSYSVISTMNVRKSPSTNSAVVRTLLANDIVIPLDIAGTDSWINIGVDEWVCVEKSGKRYLLKN